MKTEKQKRQAPYGIRIGDYHKKKLKQKAKKVGLSLHAYCLNLLINEADK